MIARLHLVASALNDVVTREEVVELVVRQGMAALDADGGILATVRDDGLLHAAAAFGYPPELVRQFLPMPLQVDTPLTRAIVTDLAVFAATLEDRAEFAGLAGVQSGAIGLAAFPLTVEGHTFGVLGISFRSGRQLSETERLFTRTLADMCASALTRIERRDLAALALGSMAPEDSPRSSALNQLRLGAMCVTMSADSVRDTEDADLGAPLAATLDQMNEVVEEIHARALAASLWNESENPFV